MKVEEGVMVMKDGKAWGAVYSDGYSTTYGWVDPEGAPINDPKYCKKPTDLTHEGSSETHELMTAKLVKVRRVTTLEVQD